MGNLWHSPIQTGQVAKWIKIYDIWQLTYEIRHVVCTLSVCCHHAVQVLKIAHFSTLSDIGGQADCAQTVTALNAYFVPHVNTAFAWQTFYQLKQNLFKASSQGLWFWSCYRQSNTERCFESMQSQVHAQEIAGERHKHLLEIAV